MQTLPHEKAIRYLGIAVVVISALALIGTVVAFILMGVSHAALNTYGPDMIQQGYEYGRGHHGSGYYGDLSVNEAMGMAGLALGLGYVALAWELITAVVSLIAGILAIRGAADRTKLGGVFGWGIAGAVAAFLGGRLVTCVLLIITAVFAHKDKSAPAYPAAGYGYAAPAPGYGQPVAPTAGYGAPAAPAPAPAQPVDPQAQAYQAAYQQSYGAPVAPVAGAAAAAAVNAAESGEAARAAAAYAAAAAQPVAAPVADGAAQAAAAVNAAESGEAARAAQEYAAGVASTEAAGVAHLAADATQAAEGDTVVVIEDAAGTDGAEAPKA